MVARALLLAVLCAMRAAGDLAEGLRFFDIRNGAPLMIGPVDRDTVEGFELLYATPGTGDIAEIAGHLLLRIKLKPNPSAPPDAVPDDLVLSFLADTGEVPPSPAGVRIIDCRRGNWLNLVLPPGGRADGPPLRSIWQSILGLGGGFEVATDLQTLAYTLKSYTVDQDRNLLRYELVLTDAQRVQLIDHLIHLRTQPPPAYFFFHQNCASVLVRVIGEGVGDDPTADFGPWVSPPHTLLALLVRRGLARPVVPTFFGFRNRGHLHREPFMRRLDALAQAEPELPWPDYARFVDRREGHRAKAMRALTDLLPLVPPQHAEIYALASLAQEMEMVFDPKDRLCRDYTSRATSEARLLQRAILLVGGPVGEVGDLAVPTPAVGSAHTGLYAFAPGVGVRRVSGESDRAGFYLAGALLSQDMGSRSALAMQRAGFLELGGYEVFADGHTDLRLTGLQLRKFRENLGHVPSVFASPRGWGLGIRLLDFERRRIGPERSASLAGISALANLASSPGYRHYAFVGAGVDIGYLREHGQSDWGPAFPVQGEALISLGKLQWRNRVVWTHRQLQQGEHEWQANSRLEYPLGEKGGAEFNLHIQSEWREADLETEQRTTLGLHIHRF